MFHCTRTEYSTSPTNSQSVPDIVIGQQQTCYLCGGPRFKEFGIFKEIILLNVYIHAHVYCCILNKIQVGTAVIVCILVSLAAPRMPARMKRATVVVVVASPPWISLLCASTQGWTCGGFVFRPKACRACGMFVCF